MAAELARLEAGGITGDAPSEVPNTQPPASNMNFGGGGGDFNQMNPGMGMGMGMGMDMG